MDAAEEEEDNGGLETGMESLPFLFHPIDHLLRKGEATGTSTSGDEHFSDASEGHGGLESGSSSPGAEREEAIAVPPHTPTVKRIPSMQSEKVPGEDQDTPRPSLAATYV